MITNAILFIIYSIILGITAPLRLLDDVSLDNNFIQSIDTASSYISSFNELLPVTTLLTIFGLFTAFELVYFSYKTIMWLIKKIPMID